MISVWKVWSSFCKFPPKTIIPPYPSLRLPMPLLSFLMFHTPSSSLFIPPPASLSLLMPSYSSLIPTYATIFRPNASIYLPHPFSSLLMTPLPLLMHQLSLLMLPYSMHPLQFLSYPFLCLLMHPSASHFSFSFSF